MSTNEPMSGKWYESDSIFTMRALMRASSSLLTPKSVRHHRNRRIFAIHSASHVTHGWSIR